jgi:phage shock protein C
VICGVCGGIARYFNVDPTVVRVATVLLVAFAGLSLWVYIIAALIMPKEC